MVHIYIYIYYSASMHLHCEVTDRSTVELSIRTGEIARTIQFLVDFILYIQLLFIIYPCDGAKFPITCTVETGRGGEELAFSHAPSY